MSKIVVTTPLKGGFRRAGFRFTDEPTVIDTKNLTKAQSEALQSERRISIRPLDKGEEDLPVANSEKPEEEKDDDKSDGKAGKKSGAKGKDDAK